MDDGQKPEALQQPIQQPDGEVGGTHGLEPTRFGDWEHNGRCSDF